MNKINSGGHDTRYGLVVLIILGAVYIALSLIAPAAATTNKYGLSLAQVNILRFTFIVPLIFIWSTIFFSILRFGRYHSHIKASPEGEAFRKIIAGLWMLLLATLVPSLVTSIANFWPTSATVLQYSTIIRNYLTVVFYITAFWY